MRFIPHLGMTGGETAAACSKNLFASKGEIKPGEDRIKQAHIGAIPKFFDKP